MTFEAFLTTKILAKAEESNKRHGARSHQRDAKGDLFGPKNQRKRVFLVRHDLGCQLKEDADTFWD